MIPVPTLDWLRFVFEIVESMPTDKDLSRVTGLPRSTVANARARMKKKGELVPRPLATLPPHPQADWRDELPAARG